MDSSKLNLSADGKTLYEVYDVDNLIIPEGVTKIDKCAASQRSIETIEIPNSVEEIGKEAFRICKSLQTVIIGAGVKKMGAEAFAGCECLNSVTIKEGAKVIGESAFYKDVALEKITLPESLTKIGKAAFQSTSLAEVRIPANVKTIGADAFNVRKLEGKTGPSVLKTIEFAPGSKLTAIEENAFKDASIETLVLPDKLQTICDFAFAGCKNLKSIHIPASLIDMGIKPFDGCTALTEITIDPANPAFVLQDGKLFTKDMKKQKI